MADELKDIITEQQKLAHDFKEYAEKSQAEIKKFGDELPETKQALERINARLDSAEKSLTSLNRPASPEADPAKEDRARTLAFRKALCTPDRLTAEEKKLITACVVQPDGEVKTLSTDNFTGAGALVAPAAFAEGIVKDITEISPIRQMARNITMGAKSMLIPIRTAAAVASWSAERGTRTEDTTLAYGQKELVAHSMTCLYKATLEQLEDSAFAIEQELSSEFTEAFAFKEGKSFISGTAVGQPEGILSNATVIALESAGGGMMVSGSATVFTCDNIIDLVANLKDAYAVGASFLMNRKTLAFLRKLKAGDGHYLWQPAFDMDNPPTIEGFPYALSPDMAAPSAGTFSTNTYPIIFGNLQNGYRVGTRKILTVQRLAELYAASGEVGFLGTFRVAGLVANAAAIKVLKIST